MINVIEILLAHSGLGVRNFWPCLRIKQIKTNPSLISFSPLACEQGWTEHGAF